MLKLRGLRESMSYLSSLTLFPSLTTYGGSLRVTVKICSYLSNMNNQSFFSPNGMYKSIMKTFLKSYIRQNLELQMRMNCHVMGAILNKVYNSPQILSNDLTIKEYFPSVRDGVHLFNGKFLINLNYKIFRQY